MQPAYHASEAGAAPYGSYGSAPDPMLGGGYQAKSPFGQPRKSINMAALAACLLLPWMVFTAVYSLSSLSVHYESPELVTIAQLLSGALVLLLGGAVLQHMRREDGQPSWYIFLFLTTALALVVGSVMGNANFKYNMVPFKDVSNMNSYELINPTTGKGNQVMDAGRVKFVDEAKLDLTKAMGFRNLDTYCVVPIVTGNEKQDNYDFWAVGTNCCSSHVSDFHCGEFNNPQAHSGLRLMREDLRAYFRLGVEQAEAAYNIGANHPIFFYWMQDPQTEISAYENACYTNWMVGVFVAFGIQLLFVVAATIGFAKFG